MDRIAHLLVHHRKRVLALTGLTTLLAVACLFRMDFNADVTASLQDGNARGEAFAQLQAKYDATDPITVVLKRADGWRDRAGLEALMETKAALLAVDGVGSVGTMVPELHPLLGTPFTRRSLDSLPSMFLPKLTSGPGSKLLLSEDGTATMAVVSPGDEPISTARRLQAAKLPAGVTATFAGNPVVFASVLDMLGWFLLAIPPSVIGLLLLVFAANIGSRKLAALSILPAVLGSVWTFGLIFGLGFEVDIVTIIVPVFVIVMGSADGLHFVTHLQEARRTQPDPEERVATALREVGVPMILTTISTAAGFLSLLATDVRPIRELGVFVAVGITFAGIISFFSLPALLSGLEIPEPSKHAVGHRLTGLLKKAAGHRAVAVVLAVSLTAFAGATLPGLAVNPDQLFYFKADHPVRASFHEVAELFGGATPLFGELAVDPSRPLAEQADDLKAVTAELAGMGGVKQVFSILDVADAVPESKRADLYLGKLAGPLGKMVAPDGVRFVLFPGRFTTDELQAWLAWADAEPRVRVLTGMPVLFDEISRLVLRAQVSSLALAFALVFAMLLIAYRRLGTTLTAMIPLALTTAVLLGFIAVSGIQLHLLTAVISSIVLGVGIDYAIHLVAAVEHARPQGHGYVLRALDSAGRPIVANALGIAIGMSALFLSPLKPHSQIAGIMWVSMITAAATALVLIPALLPRDGVRAPPA
jgi:predicted RND superfamily exporter protein